MNKRQQTILDLLEDASYIDYNTLAKRFETSSMTIRRDADDLEKVGKVIKTKGGIRARETTNLLYESDIKSRQSANQSQKRAIAQALLPHLQGEEVLFLDGGTTSVEAARLIARECHGKRVITNSMLVCQQLCQNQNNEVVLLGGSFTHDSATFTGMHTLADVEKYYIDMAIFSTKGLRVDKGAFESSTENFTIKQAIAKRSAKCTLLADHSKFGQQALCLVFDMSTFALVITDGQTPKEDVSAIRKQGITCDVAKVGQISTGVKSTRQLRHKSQTF